MFLIQSEQEYIMNAESTEKKKEFGQTMTDILNFGALNLAMSIGYRTGLFDVMDTFDTPQTVTALAEKAGLNSRYIREWLGVMTTGGIVELSQDDEEQSRFFLPKAHADLLTRRAGNENLGVYTQEIPLLATCALEPVVQGFSTGEGVNYDHYPRFQAFMTELANAKHRQVLVQKFLPSVADGDIIRQMQSGIRVCDLGCGEGLATVLMAAAFPQSEFVGIDIDQEALQKARSEAEKQTIQNLKFVQIDAAALENDRSLKESFDYITAFDAIHDQTRPLQALKGVYSLLKPDGIFSMVDIAAESNIADNLDHPMGPFLYTVSLMHCMPVGLVDGGSGLGMMWGREKAVEMLAKAGFQRVEVAPIPDDPFNFHFLCRK
jgi:ubiquinone/menaquinone biosynthesis C-methylase UbiE